MAVIYFGGGEDSEFYQMGGGGVTTTSTRFRSAYARCALTTIGLSTAQGDNYWQNAVAFAQSEFWFTAQTIIQAVQNVANPMIDFLDASNIPRLRISGAGGSTTLWRVDKLNAAGTVTQLGSNFSMSVSSSSVDKLDVNIVYSASGTFTLYLNRTQVFTYSGDVTTDSATALANIRLRCETTTGLGNVRCWSEVIVSDSDTRAMSLKTFPPVANGNTHDFDVGSPAAANVNEITLDDATLDGSSLAGQIDEYTITSLTPGTFAVVSIGVSARVQYGIQGPSPTQVALIVRTGGTDYFSDVFSPEVAWTSVQNWWAENPDTSSAWADVPVNIGALSVE